MSDQPNQPDPSLPNDPRKKTLSDPAQTTDLPAQESVGPDETTDLPARGASSDTARRTDTSVQPGGRNGETGTYNAPPTFDPARTGAFDSDDAAREFATVAGPSLPGYEILGELGRGGMGVVYKAKQIALNRVVAIKMILARAHASREIATRFLAEAQAVARFQHPNLVQVFEVGEFEGMPFFTLEFVEGGTLSKKIAREPQPPKFAAETVEQLARAMQYAHARGIAHRDLKPANILLAQDGTPKITDFGLAKSLEGDSGQTQSGQIMGTPSYMAPEQADGRPDVGPPADVYALGSILYDLLTGRPPFAGSSVLDTLEMVRTREPVPPSQLTGKLPRDLETICLKALQKDIAKRYASAGELADDLRRFLDNRPILARPVGKIEKAWRWAGRNPAGAGVVGLASTLFVVLLIASGVLYVAEAKATESAKNESEAKEFAQGKQKEAEDALEHEKAALAREQQARIAEQAATQLAIERLKVAGEQRNQALLAIREVLRPIDEQMKNRISLYPLRLSIINLMLKRLDEIRETGKELKNPLDDRTEAVAYSRMGGIYLETGQVSKAAEILRKAAPILKTVADETKPDTLERVVAMFNIAGISNQLADAEWRLGNGAKARELYAAALKVRQDRLVVIEGLLKTGKAKPDDVANAQFSVAESFGLVASADLRLGDPDSAVENYLASDKAFAALRTAATLPVRMRRAEIQLRLGDARLYQRRPDDAEKHYRAGVAEHETLLKLTPASTGFHPVLRANIAQSRLYLGDFLLMARKDATAAEKEYETSLTIFNDLLKLVPDNIDVQRRAAAIEYRLGYVARQRSGFARVAGIFGANHHFRESFRVRDALAKVDPTDTPPKVELMLVLGRLGRAAEAAKLAEELLKIKDVDQQVRFQVVCGLAVASGSASDEALTKRCRDRAFTELAELVRNWKARGQLEMDPDLESLRGDPRFAALVGK